MLTSTVGTCTWAHASHIHTLQNKKKGKVILALKQGVQGQFVLRRREQGGRDVLEWPALLDPCR